MSNGTSDMPGDAPGDARRYQHSDSAMGHLIDQQVELDLRYISERSFWLDLKLLLRTVPVVLTTRGAY